MLHLAWLLIFLLTPARCKHPGSAKKSDVDDNNQSPAAKRQLPLKLFGQSGDSDEDPEKLLERVKQVSPERLNAILASYAPEQSHKISSTVTGETRKLDPKTSSLMDELTRISENSENGNVKDLQSAKAEFLASSKKASPLDTNNLSPEPGTYDPLAIKQILAGRLGKIRSKDLEGVTESSNDMENIGIGDDAKASAANLKLRQLNEVQAQDVKNKLLAELASKSETSPLTSQLLDSENQRITNVGQDLALRTDDQERKMQLKNLGYSPDSLLPLSKYLRRHHLKKGMELSDNSDLSSYLALHNRHRIHRILGSQGQNLMSTQLTTPPPKSASTLDATPELLPGSNENAPIHDLQNVGKSLGMQNTAENLKAMVRLQEKLATNSAVGTQGSEMENSAKVGSKDSNAALGNLTSDLAVTKSKKPGFAFSYDRDSPLGPDMWSVLHSEWTCRGIKQSPIDIQTDQICRDGLCESEFVRNVMIKVFPQDKPIVGVLRNNGHAPTLSIGEEVSVRFFGANLNNMYYLKQLHFHFGCDNRHGSEHRIDGQTYPLELHLVFWDNKTFPTFAQAAKSDHGIVVVAVLFQRSFIPTSQVRNTPLAQFLQVVKKIEEEDDQVRITEIFDLRLERMIPNAMNVEQADRFFVYEGSLTTPGCYESVTWVIYDTHPIVTDDQLEVFRRLKSSKVQDATGGDKMCDNYRPLQKLNGRRIYSNIV